VKKKLTVWILQTGEPLPIDGSSVRPMRAINLANALVEKGHSVVLWSSRFSHQTKTHRSKQFTDNVLMSKNLEVRLIDSPGYKKNIGFSRLFDHYMLGKNLAKSLKKNIKKPDVAFIGFPPIEIAMTMSNWLIENNIPYLVDVKDLWPEVFVEKTPVWSRVITKILFHNYFISAKKIYIGATGITSMSQSFVKKILSISNREMTSNDCDYPLVPALDVPDAKEINISDDWWDKEGVGEKVQFRVIYVGNLSSNVEMDSIKKAALYFSDKGIDVEFVICGQGDYLGAFKKLMNGVACVKFPGWIDRSKTISLAKRSDMMLIPYYNSENFFLSLPNKTIDALALGLPILSTLEGEVKDLITANNVGKYYNDGAGLINEVLNLIEDPLLLEEMSNNANKLYNERYTYEHVYGGLVHHLERVASSI
jgi:glycosyltransferase involved in cell wall biosynthesis